eukprot:TRINITY_DN9205_c0_g1_i1.p1 TRINITY_DN9205_c0_g1~~TRINITY_DN9205_c0_g1_i1.p1  ORF type:complete len:198 (+),score=57.90 TRINITY_DN9205_c0_g1_i1:400-993(+)
MNTSLLNVNTSTISNNMNAGGGYGITVLFDYVNWGVARIERVEKELKQMQYNKLHVAEMGLERLVELANEYGEGVGDLHGTAFEDEAGQKLHYTVYFKLIDLIEAKEKELDLLIYILENVVVMLWRHLEYYLRSSLYQSEGRAGQEGEGMVLVLPQSKKIELRDEARDRLDEVLSRLTKLPSDLFYLIAHKLKELLA